MESIYSFSAEGRQSTKQRRVKTLNADEYAGAELPESYTCNSNKEELCLEYVRHFNSNFKRLYPKRKPLFLISRNEYGVEKFVSTTVRPTLMPFREVYDVEKIAEFCANYLDFEPLEVPDEPPSCLPSPAQVLSWSVGDSFDFSVLLTSCLLGAGYDAFVVYGTAPRWVTLRNQSRSPCPLQEKEKAEAKEAEAQAKSQVKKEEPSKYAVEPRGVPKSTFDVDVEAKKAAAELKEPPDWFHDVDELAWDETDDSLSGTRVHAWVLVRPGKRDSEGFVFVEPSTGEVKPCKDCPYMQVEAVWNAKNYWVNMQPDTPARSLNFDLKNEKLWEYVFIDPALPSASGEAKGEEDVEPVSDLADLTALDAPGTNGGGGAAEVQEEENILDVPPSWVSKLELERSQFNLRYPPHGQRTILYHKAKLELFAENMHDEGTVSRLFLYKDRAQTIVEECREEFLNRKDKLSRRIRFPLENKSREIFLPGRGGQVGLKELVEWTGVRREFYFYKSARQDGLVSREEDVAKKIIERFEGRQDRLMYRSVTLKEDRSGMNKMGHTLPSIDSRDSNAAELVYQKATVKYERDPSVDADSDIAKRTFYIQEKRIRTLYHYGDGRITRKTTMHTGDKTASAQQSIQNDDEDGETYQDVQMDEKETLAAIRTYTNEINELIRTRRREEELVEIVRPIFDTARERRAEDKAAEAKDEPEEEVAGNQVDYLTPFLQHIADKNNLTRDEAQRARDACLKSLKDRVLERANIIQNRLNEENSKLSKRQATYQRNATREQDQAADDEFEKFCSDAMFRIQILEQRLINHEETALKRYTELDERLSADPRLAILNNP